MAVLTPLEILEPKEVGCKAASFSFIVSTLSCMAGGRWVLGPLVRVEKTRVQRSSNLSKNSVGSGMSFGVGANFKPNDRAVSWSAVRTLEDRFNTVE